GEQGGASGVDLDALYEAALEEGGLIAYMGNAESATQNMLEGFNEQYPGIEVEFIRLNSAGIAQRFGAERGSGAPTADLLNHGAVAAHLTHLEEGWIVPSEELPLPDGYPSEFIDPQLGPVIANPLPVILYNTDLVGEDEIPTTWEDLTDPRWQGEVLMGDLEEQTWHLGVYGTVVETFGEEWAESFMANEPRVIAGGVAPITELIAAGEAAVAPIGFAPIAEAVKASGAPIDYTTPDPQTAPPTFIAINSEAENPNAARLLFHYLHTEDGVERFTLFGTRAPYQTDQTYEWVDDDIRWVTDPEWADEIAALFGQ
ncbi:MAG: extracellular solute-binding protein, partial [Nitriliruptor sp.]